MNTSAVSNSSGSSSFGSASASSSGTSSILVPRSAAIFPKFPSVDRVDGGDAEAGAEHAVVGERRAAALDVAEDRHARLEARALLDLALEHDGDPAEPRVAERVRAAVLAPDVPVLRGRPLGHDDDRERGAVGLAALEPLADLVEVERPLGHEDHVGAAGEAGVAGDPAGVAAHHLDDDHAVVRLRGRVQAVDRVGRDLHRGLEAEREVGAGEVVVDRLRDADDAHAVVHQPPGHAERVLAADRDQRVDPLLVEHGLELLEAALLLVGVRPRRAEDRAAAVQDAARVLVRERGASRRQHAGPAVAEADEVVAVHLDPLAHDGADDRVEAGAVSAAREYSDP